MAPKKSTTNKKKTSPEADSKQRGRSTKPAGVSKPPPRFVKGLKSNTNACFSHAIVQALAAALSTGGAQSAGRHILGDATDLPDLNVASGRASRQKKAAVKQLQDRIALGGPEVSVSKRLSALLDSIRNPGCSKTNQLLQDFQAVVAHSSDSRANFTGETQEDVSEYHLRVNEALKDDPHCADPAALSDEFDFFATEGTTCKKCGTSRNVRDIPNNNHHIIYLATANQQKTSVSDLFSRSTTTDVDSNEPCAKCNGTAFSRDTNFTKLPRTIAVHVNRSMDGSYSKDKTPIDYSSKTIEINGSVHNLFAVIQHGGKNTRKGHYAIFRKVSYSNGNHRWYLIDGEEVREVPDEAVADDGEAFERGQSAMFFFRRTKPAQSPAETSLNASASRCRSHRFLHIM
ncbi:cysteine proteinase [Teratosphaeria nubilosa]|uniref:Cysteine proteinase n=1 Tax=Teratosphaeria nubilosa TaxID=161662 RepID=A0A6G1LEJ9_9PEZI|nr:cysteine proteinase [Teratosphaeria nubilosa]